MRLFTRNRTARPDPLLDARQHAVELAEMVRSITGDHIKDFAVRFGVPMGTTMWSVRIESQAHLQSDFEKLLADNHVDAVGTLGDCFVVPAQGGFADVMWTVGAETLAGVDAIEEMQVSDTRRHDLLDESSGWFVESSGVTRIVGRLG